MNFAESSCAESSRIEQGQAASSRVEQSQAESSSHAETSRVKQSRAESGRVALLMKPHLLLDFCTKSENFIHRTFVLNWKILVIGHLY